MNDSLRYDICVIGAGAGGLVIAAVASQLGLNVVLCEQGLMGGDCLNYGCVPSKSLLSVAKRVDACRNLKIFGLKDLAPTINYEKIHQYIHDTIAKIAPNDSVNRFESLGVTVIKGKAAFSSRRKIIVNNQEIFAKKFVVATGSRPIVPLIAGLDSVAYLTNETFFDLHEQPEHLVIIGGGPIGVELAAAQLMLGTKVTLLARSTILSKDDPEAVEIIRKKLLAKDLVLHENCKVEHVSDQGGGITVTANVGNQRIEMQGSHLLVSTGRAANIEKLNLDVAGIAYDHAIQVNKSLRTTNKHVYALGDVIGGFQFTHAASYEAGIVIRKMIFKLPARVNYASMPWVTYTDPELAQVGLNESMLTQQGLHFTKTIFPLAEIDRNIAESTTDGFIKVLSDKKGRILGVTIVGYEAGEQLLMWALAIQNKLRLKQVAALIAPYPTRSEVSKRVVGRYFEPYLYSNKIKKILKLLWI